MPGAGPITESGAGPATEPGIGPVTKSGAGPAIEPGAGPIKEPRAELVGTEKSSVPIVISHNHQFWYTQIA